MNNTKRAGFSASQSGFSPMHIVMGIGLVAVIVLAFFGLPQGVKDFFAKFGGNSVGLASISSFGDFGTEDSEELSGLNIEEVAKTIYADLVNLQEATKTEKDEAVKNGICFKNPANEKDFYNVVGEVKAETPCADGEAINTVVTLPGNTVFTNPANGANKYVVFNHDGTTTATKDVSLIISNSTGRRMITVTPLGVITYTDKVAVVSGVNSGSGSKSGSSGSTINIPNNANAGQLADIAAGLANILARIQALQNQSTVPASHTAPSAPYNLSANYGFNYVSLHWSPSVNHGSSSLTEYRVYRTSSISSVLTLSCYGSIATSCYDIQPVQQGVTYYYLVTARNSYGESGPSNSIAVHVAFSNSNTNYAAPIVNNPTPNYAAPTPNNSSNNLYAPPVQNNSGSGSGSSNNYAAPTQNQSNTNYAAPIANSSRSNYAAPITNTSNTSYASPTVNRSTPNYAAPIQNQSNTNYAAPAVNLASVSNVNYANPVVNTAASQPNYAAPVQNSTAVSSSVNYARPITQVSSPNYASPVVVGSNFSAPVINNNGGVTPGAPGNLRATLNSDNTVSLFWDFPPLVGTSISGHRVYRTAISGGNRDLIATISPACTCAYGLSAPASGQTFYFTVNAFGPGGEGPRSNEVPVVNSASVSGFASPTVNTSSSLKYAAPITFTTVPTISSHAAPIVSSYRPISVPTTYSSPVVSVPTIGRVVTAPTIRTYSVITPTVSTVFAPAVTGLASPTVSSYRPISVPATYSAPITYTTSVPTLSSFVAPVIGATTTVPTGQAVTVPTIDIYSAPTLGTTTAPTR